MKRYKSFAKVNLILRVLGKRGDGYHDIASLMNAISLHDELGFEPRPGGIWLACPDSSLPVDDKNIVFRAAQMLFAQAGYQGGVGIEIRKKIPIAAGLGGGSSNAATTLVALNELFELGVSTKELTLIGSRLGADVPFFIHNKTAWATGIGDILSPAPALPPFWLVLVNPGFEVSTASVYGKLNLGLTRKAVNYSIPPLYTTEELASFLENDLEQVTVGLFPVIDLMKQRLLAAGAAGSIMSGSGPTVFGIFASEGEAYEGARRIAKDGCPEWEIYLASSLIT